MPSGFRSGPGSSSSGFRAGGAGYGGFRGERIPTTKRKKSWWDQVFDIAATASGIGPALLSEVGPEPISRGIGRAGSVLTTAPLATLFYPKQTVASGMRTIRGIWELPPALYTGIRKEGLGTTLDMLWDSIKADYQNRYGENWKEAMRDDPLANLFDALTVFGTAIRGVSLAGAASRLGKTGARYTPMDIWRESARPGLLSEGAPWMRELRYQPPTGKEQLAYQPYSRSPFRRGTQMLTDYISESLPEFPGIGISSRIARTNAKTLNRNIDRVLGQPAHIDAIDKLPDAGRSRLFWGSQLGSHADSSLKELRGVLEREFADNTATFDMAGGHEEFAGWLYQAKQRGFGDELLKRLDAAIEYQPDDRYWRAVDSMRDMTEIVENVIADADGFTSLSTDLVRARDRLEDLDPSSDAYTETLNEINDLTEALDSKEESLRLMFHDRRRRLLDWVKAKTYADVPEREAWLDKLTELFGEEQAQTMIKFADGMANVKKSPARFWRDSIGMPGDESAEEFMSRAGQDALLQRFGPFGTTKLVEGDVLKPAPTTAFHSPLQKWITENWPPTPTVPPVELRGKLRKALTPEEYEVANLDMFFDEMAQMYGPNDPISQSDLQRWLAHPLNSHNLIEHHVTNTPEAFGNEPIRTHDDPSLVSREPRRGEYHELVYQIPRPLRDYTGRGYAHWGKKNIVFHVRFQEFMEGGKRKLLVEEIQSDWAADYRKHMKYVNLTPEDKARHADILGEINDAQDSASEIFQRYSHDWWDPLDQEVIDARDEYDALLKRVDRLLDEANAMVPPGSDVVVPPSPWGNRYLSVAARRLMRYARDNGLDEIIISDPSVQHVRNAKQAIKGLERYVLERVDNAEVRDVLDANPNPAWQRNYRDKMKQVFDQELGEEGRVVEDAYQGRYSGQAYPGESIEGDMRGLVYSVTPSVRERAEISLGLFQRQPDWDALPRGATELLAGGGTRVHIFKDGNVSTWIHELGHVGLHDLDDADRALLDAHYAGGKALDGWKAAEHESFARDWERYVREGIAPTRALETVFKRLAQWMRAVLGKEDEADVLPDDIKKVFAEMFRAEDEPDIFIPHRAGAADLGGGRTTKGIPRARRDIGDRTISRIPLFKYNTLALLRSGLLNDDPRLLIEHMNRIVMLSKANQLREAVLEMGEKLMPGEFPNFETQYLVKRAGSGVDKPLYDALEAADDPGEIRDAVKNFIDERVTGDRDKGEAWVRQAQAEGWKGKDQLYVVDKRSVDLLFKNVTGKTPGATTKPMTTGGVVVDAALDSLRSLLLYANPGFYMSNMVGNFWMMATSDPRAAKYLTWSMRNAAKAAKPGEDMADPLWERISIEMGRGPTSGGFSYRPQFIGQGPGRSSRVARRTGEEISYGAGRWGKRAGRVIDDSFRVAAWRQVASKHGYKTEKQIRELLDEAGTDREELLKLDTKARRDLASIRDEAENLMLDFDSLTPFERTWLQRIIFLYPFIRASAKYPFMFAGERPIVAGAMGQAGLIGTDFADQIYGPRPDLPAWASGYARGPGGWWNVGAFSPHQMSLDLAESLMGLGQPTEIGINRPYSYINPGLQLAVSLARSQNRYGRDAPASEILRSDFPAPAYIAQLWGRKPSEVYSDRDKLATLLRSLRVVPFGVEEQ